MALPTTTRCEVAGVQGRVWAAGDVTGTTHTHASRYQASVVAANILGQRREADYSAIPRCVFTTPSVFAVGVVPSRRRTARTRSPRTPPAASPAAASPGRGRHRRRGPAPAGPAAVAGGDRAAGAPCVGGSVVAGMAPALTTGPAAGETTRRMLRIAKVPAEARDRQARPDRPRPDRAGSGRPENAASGAERTAQSAAGPCARG